MDRSFKNFYLIFSIIAVLLTAIFLFKIAHYGFDFSDEGFYLNSANYRNEYPTTFSYFGFINGFIFDLLNGNIINFRIFNVCVIYLIGFLTILTNYKCSLDNKSNIKIWPNIYSNIFLLALISFFSLGYGILTPSYNTINFYGFCIISISLNFCRNNNSKNKFIFLYSVGFSLIALSKPTSLIPLSIFSFLLLMKKGKKFIFTLFICSLFSILISIYLFSGQTIDEAFSYVIKTIEYYGILDSGHDLSLIKRPLGWIIRVDQKYIFGFIVLISLNLLNIIKKKTNFHKINFYILIITLPIYGSLFLIFGLPIVNFFLISLPISFLIYYFIKSSKIKDKINNINFQIAFFNLFLPFAYAFGSNRNYWEISQDGSIFYVISAILFLNLIRFESEDPLLIINLKRFFSQISFFTIVLVNVFIINLTINPYRQNGNLFSFDNLTEIGLSSSPIYLSSEFSEYINEANSSLVKEGFKPETPILDMSGRLPGFIYAIKGKVFGHPWIAGGYPGSNKFARKILTNIPLKNFEKVWILIEEDGTRSLDNKILLSNLKLNVFDKKQYKKVFDKKSTTFENNSGTLGHLSIYKPLS